MLADEQFWVENVVSLETYHGCDEGRDLQDLQEGDMQLEFGGTFFVHLQS